MPQSFLIFLKRQVHSHLFDLKVADPVPHPHRLLRRARVASNQTPGQAW
jgi:hypothetical protein